MQLGREAPAGLGRADRPQSALGRPEKESGPMRFRGFFWIIIIAAFGLLSIGEEDTKGNEASLAAMKLLRIT